MTRKPNLSILRVPFDLGAGRKGVRLGPDAILRAGLERKLRQLGFSFELPEPVPAPLLSAASTQPAALKHLNEVVEVNESLALQIKAVLDRGRFPLVLGGDHSIAIGTLTGLRQHYRSLGVIWFDAHSDLNTPDTSPSGNIHGMSLAAALGKGHDRLTRIGGVLPKIQPQHTVIIGARQLDPGEKELIHAEGITCFTMHEVDRMGIARVMEEALRLASAGTDGVHVSFDIDSVDPLEAPGTGTPVKGGLSYREAHLALELLHESGVMVSAEMVEVNPALERDNKTARLAVELILSLLGQRIL
ncbi:MULTISPECIES: arginase [unclassified Paenibacillus]|uniref:arginase n=1 Tax=unclassified Paenibacillus TaxID=185978 RepID=UPI001AE92960|nr:MULTISPECIES: arginase [unclassified Paenibacillus]MBP1156172.1 arginase [Paenibacillus sp. PvP091]MBP1168442.1 arginase [Paenibacillus sp. PvR098]MBP2439470.1 arginase [Paenibacillus sp. PvP052]